ncbi:MAG: hypothetical protein K8T91_13570 [Planctomycetes bacterium]|nr:hypothetical protein [Planctomycetota bacterium]
MPSGLTLTVLRDTLRSAEPAALLVEPRILRRVIRLDRRLAGLGFFVPHRKCYTIDRGRLLAFVDRTELDLPAQEDLARRVILLAKPADDDALDQMQPAAALAYYERLLFHARVHLELERRIAELPQTAELASKRREQIGESEFAEIRAVLLKDGYLFPHPSDLDTYTEFAAVYLELRYFAPEELSAWFPAIRDWARIEHIVSQDIYHAQLFEGGRLATPALLATPSQDVVAQTTTESVAENSDGTSSPTRALRLAQLARRAAGLGNSVKAAILQAKAAAAVRSEDQTTYLAAARQQLDHLTDRLREVLNLSDTAKASWRSGLQDLLEPAARGFWSTEARLLYDLQKVCVERERGIFKLDLFHWCASLIKVALYFVINVVRRLLKKPRLASPAVVALRRPLPLLREALIAKHLRTARRRLPSARLTPGQRDSLSELIGASLVHAELCLRERLRPLVVGVFDRVGLVPENVPERVARRKLIEELLDRVVEQGFFSMGNLRDALSRNDLKLPDVSGPLELIRGDRLLKADDRLARDLEGVYRRGTVYLRWPQRLSSLAFGTPYGRFFTQYVALPFGGSFLALEGLRHIIGWFMPATVKLSESPSGQHLLPLQQLDSGPGWPFYSAVFFLGIWLMMLMHLPRFRRQIVELLSTGWRLLKQLVIEMPRRLVESPLVQRVYHSAAYRAVRSYFMRPALVTLMLQSPSLFTGRHWSLSATLNVFLAAALFLNSPIGRHADELLTDFLGRAWYDLRMRVFAAAYQWIMDVFHQLLVVLERVVYTVDEWLRFRSGDSVVSRGVKLVTGACWFVVSYVILFVFTLLVEPQINPIKHFPVVTVSHKLILPTGVPVANYLAPYLGKAEANTLVWSTIWLIPGVFGFLVWELKENWRLYAANRRQRLSAIAIGSHGETMVRLLRPGFHSGTLPKKFGLLRKAVRRSRRIEDPQRVSRRQDDLHHVEMAVRNFVERELIGLCEEAQLVQDESLRIGEVRLATNRVEVEVLLSDATTETMRLAWEEQDGHLTAVVDPAGWLEMLSSAQREALATAISGLLQRSGAEEAHGKIPLTVQPTFSWTEWIAFWATPPVTMPLKGPHTVPLSPTSRAG